MNKKILVLTTLVLSLAILPACSGQLIAQDAQDEEERYTERQMKEANKQVGMPAIDNFFEKRLAKQIFELRDNSELITYAYNVNLNGKYIYIGKAIGFGLPYSVQYTSPEKVGYYRDTTVPQADPNGLYMPDGLSATWLMIINEEGDREIIYTEPRLVVTQSKLPKRLVADWSLTENY